MHEPWLPAALAFGLLLALSASVLADHGPTELQVEGQRVAEPIEPLGTAAELRLNVTVPCPPNGTGEAWLTVRAPQAPAFVDLAFGTERVDAAPSCSEEDHALDVPVRVAIRLHQQAPAFQQVEIPVVATGLLNSTNESRALGPAEASVTVTPGYFNLYNVRVDQRIQQVGPQEAARYEILIDNHSNGDTRFEFSVPGTVPEGFRVVEPEPIVLASNATGGDQASGRVIFTVYAPANTPYTNEVASIQLNVTSQHAGEPAVAGGNSEVSTLTQARGLHVPGPGAVLAALTLAGLAAVVRRRGR